MLNLDREESNNHRYMIETDPDEVQKHSYRPVKADPTPPPAPPSNN